MMYVQIAFRTFILNQVTSYVCPRYPLYYTYLYLYIFVYDHFVGTYLLYIHMVRLHLHEQRRTRIMLGV